MNISRSGYYKWLKTKNILNQYEINRRDLESLIRDIHKRKLSYGYHRINYLIRKETGWVVSDNLVHKVCKILKIRSKARHYSIYKKPGEESIKYPNLINNNWNTTRPLEKITSDTTMIWFKRQRYDWTYYVDAFDDSIIGSDVKPFYHGVSMKNHKDALQDMLNDKIKRGYKSQETIFHSDQGTIYSSVAFNNAHKDYNITRSTSRHPYPDHHLTLLPFSGPLSSVPSLLHVQPSPVPLLPFYLILRLSLLLPFETSVPILHGNCS